MRETGRITKGTIDQVNQVRLHKKLCLPLELVGTTGRSSTDAFDAKNGTNQLKWNFDFPKAEEPGPKLIKTWNRFKQWIANIYYDTSYDFKEIINENAMSNKQQK